MVSRLYEWAKVRKTLLPQLIERDGLICHYCGIDLVPPTVKHGEYPYYRLTRYALTHGYKLFEVGPEYGRLTIDHKIPMSQGGSDDMDNLVMCCHKCNAGKCDEDYATYKARKSATVPDFEFPSKRMDE